MAAVHNRGEMAGQRNRCRIFDDIDALSDVRDVRELVKRLQPILSQLAYVAVTEGSVSATNEEWHDEFTDRLYSAAHDEHRNAALAAVAPPAIPPPVESRRTAGARPSGKGRSEGFPSDGVRYPGMVAPPPPGRNGRPSPGALPPSLAAIMNGTHSSFSEHDD